LQGFDSNYDYQQIYRHWDPRSERFAGADALLTAVDEGWEPERTLFYETYWFAGSRCVTVYHIELRREGEVMDMPVISNPYLRRLIAKHKPTVLPLEERDMIRRGERGNGAHG